MIPLQTEGWNRKRQSTQEYLSLVDYKKEALSWLRAIAPKSTDVETTQGRKNKEFLVPKLPRKERIAKVSSRRNWVRVVSRNGIPSHCQMVWLPVKGVGCLQHSDSHCPWQQYNPITLFITGSFISILNSISHDKKKHLHCLAPKKKHHGAGSYAVHTPNVPT